MLIASSQTSAYRYVNVGSLALKVCDVLGSVPSEKEDSPLNSKYKLLLDKGMYDTVSMVANEPDKFCETYLKNTRELLQKDGILLMATCCHTEHELKKRICKGM